MKKSEDASCIVLNQRMTKPIREFIRTIIDLLEAQEIPYAIGGSIASSAYGELRATNDVDISIIIPDEKKAPFVNAIRELGYYVDWDAILDAIIWKTPFNVIDVASNLKVDFFLVTPTPLEESLLQRTRRVPYDPSTGATAVFYSPEDVILYKLIWYREGRMPKHPKDILAILKRRHGRIDLEYISKWAREMGTEEFWNEILDEYNAGLGKTE